MTGKSFDIRDMEDLKEKVSDVKIVGEPGMWICVCKASSDSQGWMKSTKVMNIDNGCLIQVSTQQRNPDGSYAVAEALTYVPNIWFHPNKVGSFFTKSIRRPL